jgi:hypothetical protein
MNTATKGCSCIDISIYDPEFSAVILPRILGRNELRYRIFRQIQNELSLMLPKNNSLGGIVKLNDCRIDSMNPGGLRVTDLSFSTAA